MINIKTLNSSNFQTLIESIFIKFAELASSCLSKQLLSAVNVDVCSVKLMSYRKYIRSLSGSSIFAVINMKPLKCNAVLETDLSLDFSILNRLCGGAKEGKIKRMDMYEPTDIETALLEKVTVHVLESMREAWSLITDIKPSLLHINTNPILAQIARQKDKVFIINMETAIDGNNNGKMTFCIPHFAFKSFFDRFSEKYINSTDSDIQVNLTDEILELKQNILKFKEDINSNISRLLTEKKYSFFGEAMAEELDYAATFSTIVKNHIKDIVELIRFYLTRAEHKKAAVFLIALGTEPSTKIFKCLREDEIETLTFYISRLDMIKDKEKKAVLKEFYELYQINENASFGGIDYARVLLEKSVGTQKAANIINRLLLSLQVRPFDFIRQIDPENLFNVIQREYPQTIALILSYLEPKKAAIVLQKFPVDLRLGIIKRIEKLEKTNPEVLREIEKILEKKLASLSNMDYCHSGGNENVEEILNCIDPASREQVVDVLKC
ncbi:flagellar motor switch protein FliG [Treponema sp. R8-4-B8]